ncbi:Rad17 cell cycle checkpoint protein-domain-containing protein [Lobosporangium transversale]|uniref:Rad17 cell cycle checkpoint protein-domain-containing protein n=1 Tax=Lobosporangium transversale TaxID=64571 RepID=A0A1Y2G7V2_9FUNG|nr:Rad17 cell cycle checkpoint protein-domain-containing protein [Lobosporangium transversale]ORZ01842.1 Rad17 cell cycle checkpoint protein-domain-containing protein [Lobosporangium transversale]|eukprot:XP_021876139.1 Rad17 cell cycle checkpoint protein-domain-containing protein [Lobosporangium transversale]
MPPKRTRNKSSVPVLTRKAPSRDAKTRAVASTASMYKEAQAYLDDGSDDFSDQISDPEDTVSETEVNKSDQESHDETQGSDDFEGPLQTRKRSKRIQRNLGKTPASRSTTEISLPKRASATGRGRGQNNNSISTSRPNAASRKSSSSSSTTSPHTMASSVTGPKRRAGNVKFLPLVTNPTSSPPSGSHSSSGRSKASPKAKDEFQQDDQWVEKYAPTNIEEVAVHPGKIANVREWLQIYTDPRNPQRDFSGGAILVLSGPAGSGKTTVLRILAKEMGLNIVEWINTVNENNVIQRPKMPGQDNWGPSSVDEEYIPVMRAFQEFFARAHRFRPLQTTLAASLHCQEPIFPSTPNSDSTNKNLILIEDLPPISASSSRKIFQDTIKNFSNLRSKSTSVLVIIVSDVYAKQNTEMLFSNTSENRDSALTIRTLLPPSVLDRIDSGSRNNSRIKQIKFNPIAPTIMKKAIRRLIELEFKSSHSHAPDTAEVDQLIEIHDGDIRAVINALQFLCYLPTKKRRCYRNLAVEAEEELNASDRLMVHNSENKVIVGQDSSLGVFHAVAKVLYNKRDWSKPNVTFDSDIVKVPVQSWTKGRPPLRFDPEKELIEKLPVEPDLFTLMLHQNYTRHMTTIDECLTAIEYLCIADQFSNSSASSANFTQIIQMQPYMTSLAVRGLLYAPTLAGPTYGGNVRGGQKKHWWPELFAVNRAMRANDQQYSEVTADLVGDEIQGLPSGYVTGSGFFPKRVVREELVPMLHKCIIANPYMPIFSKSLRPSSKNFIRASSANYGKGVGMIRKEFGEGDEGFVEELVSPGMSGEVGGDNVGCSDSPEHTIINSSTRSRLQERKQQQQQQANTSMYEMEHEDDPIEDFSD